MVEQGTHKPLVASPNLALGTVGPPIRAGFFLYAEFAPDQILDWSFHQRLARTSGVILLTCGPCRGPEGESPEDEPR